MESNKDVLSVYSEYKLQELEKLLDVKFKDKRLLVISLSHRSSIGDPLFSKEENKKLGLIGDSFLNLLLFERLYKTSNLTRSEMDQVRQTYVINLRLAELARKIGLKKYLLTEKSMDEATMESSTSIWSDSLEALVGALYLDQGFKKTKLFVDRFVLSSLSLD